MSKTYSAGIVTAYGAAKRAGYHGTYEDFCRQQAQYADNASAVEQAKQTVVSASQSADQAKQDAQGSAQSAQGSAQSAQGSAQSAGQSAQDAQTAKNNAQGYAQSASASAGSAQQSAQSAQTVLESIPEDYSDLSEDVDKLKADLADVEDKTLNAFAVESASGAVASFEDGADDIPLKRLVVGIEPVQEGTGDPSPDNVRPITGWTGVNINRTRTNIWDEQWVVGGIATDTGAFYNTNDRIRCKNHIPVKPNTTYYVKNGSNAYIYIHAYNRNHKWLRIVISQGTSNIAFTTPDDCYYIAFRLAPAYGATYNHDISINYPSTDAQYHPYAGAQYPVLWQTEAGTVYGGALDVLTGVLTVDRACVVFDGSVDEIWVSYTYAGADLTFYIELQDKKIIEDNAICNRFKNSHRCWYTATNGVLGLFSEHNASPRLYFKQPDESVTDVAKWKTWLSENKTYVVYKLTTPLTYNLTPTEVSSLLGINNIWADTGDTHAEYRADTVLYADKLTKRQSGMIAPVETSYTATRNYTVNQLLIVDNTLYKVTANIANGGSITAGTNVVATTLSEVIASLS